MLEELRLVKVSEFKYFESAELIPSYGSEFM